MGRNLVVFAAAMAAFAATTVGARIPEWAEPLVSANVATLGGNARAVRLADIGIVTFDDAGHVHRTYRNAYRILTQNGRGFARCSAPYNADTEKVTAAHAWLVRADGRLSQSFSTSDFVDIAMRVGGTFWPQQRVLSLSASDRAEVGGTFIWEFEFESQVSVLDLSWYFPTDMPTLVCSYDVTPPPGGKLSWHTTGAGVPVPTPGRTAGALHWEERNFRPPTAGDRPVGFLFTPRSLAIRAVAGNAGEQDMTWASLARLANELVEPRIAAVTPEIKAKAEELVAGRTSRWDRVRALTDFVQKEITYLAIVMDKDCLAGYRPHAASEVFANRFGDCKDKATLLIALLRAVNERGYPMLVFSGNPVAVQPDWPSPRFNHMIVALPADADVPAGWPVVDGGALGRMVVFDPTDQFAPLGVLPFHDQAGHGLIVSNQSTDLVLLPAATDEDRAEIELQLTRDGGIATSYHESYTGAYAAAQHGVLEIEARTKFTKRIEERFHATVTSMRDLKWDETWEPAQARWRFNCSFSAPAYATVSRDLVIVNPHVLSWSRNNAWKTHQEGVVWYAGRHFRETVRVVLPPGCEVEEIPDPWSGETSQIRGSVGYRRDGDAVICETEQTVTAGFLERTTYESVREFALELEAAARRPIVLRLKAAPTKA